MLEFVQSLTRNFMLFCINLIFLSIILGLALSTIN